MIVAVYARKSTEQNGVAEEARSVTLQVERARTFAESKGWIVTEEHVYVDSGISGAEFANRPGLMRLLNALRPKPPFGVLLVSDRDRIGREQLETGWVLKQLLSAGVRVFEVQGAEGREITLTSATDKIVMAVQDFAAEVEREKARTRTPDALARRARAGHVTGGALFGYGNREVRDAEGRRLHVERVVNEAEAGTVRRIFQAAADGAGFKRIAARLNAERVPSPRPRSGGPRSWTPSSVRTVLFNPSYTGRMMWGRIQKRNQWGQRKHSARPRETWVEVAAENLRVVTDELFEAARARIAADRGSFGRTTGGRPVSGSPSRYLLTGLGECALCGGGMVSATRDFKSHRRPVYVCAFHRERGNAVCQNRLAAPMEVADRAVLNAVERDLLRPHVVAYALERALAMLRPSDDSHRQQQEALRAEVVRLQAEAARLADVIATGGMDSAALLAALQERERRLSSLRVELYALGSATRVADTGAAALRGLVEKRVAEWRGLLGRQVGETRQILRHLFVGRLAFTPREDDGGRFYAFEGGARFRRCCRESYIPKDW